MILQRFLSSAVLGFCVIAIVAPSVAAAQPKPGPRGPGSLSGVWRLDGYISTRNPAAQRVTRDDTGQLPPMLPWAKALYEKRISDSDTNHPFASTTAYCLPSGMPQMMISANYPVQVLETPGQVTMLFEEQGTRRIIRLNQKHPEDVDPSFFGDSIGHWDGDTLVVDTVGLKDRLTIDLLGMPESESMHIVERIRRIAPDKLEDLIGIDDPKVFIHPWTMRHSYSATKDHIQEDVCENNRNAPENNTPAFLPKSPGFENEH